MSKYFRVKLPGGCYFFTLVTFGRSKFLTSETARHILRQVWKEVQRKHPFNVEAMCLLPDHLHCIWRLPDGDDDTPKRWRPIKAMFSKRYLKAGGIEGQRNQSRRGKSEAAVWQRRYWEHTIRNDTDFAMHFDYIHFNPVKHGFVSSPQDWKWSSFHRYLRLGYYSEEWGSSQSFTFNESSFGE